MSTVKKEKIFVGLSGGVDSSVAALRLLRAGYDVTGVFIKVWHPDFLKCDWEAERLDAMRVAAHLDIPFLTCDSEKTYREDIAEHFISEYKKGNTPNPDVLCNKHIKFGASLNFAEERGADLVATGHYVRCRKINDTYELLRGVDVSKDQSYFLWTLTQNQLEKSLFPVGDTKKSVIRKEAETAGLPTAQKKDSQGICFLGQIDIFEFLSHYVDMKAGEVLSTNGVVLGRHKGSLVYTIGQRHGFDLKTKGTHTIPHYVVSKDLTRNTITVSSTKAKIEMGTELELTDTNWITCKPRVDDVVHVQTRYRQKPFLASVASVVKNKLTLELQSSAESYAKGQSCVLYSGDRPEICIGGGIIEHDEVIVVP